MTIRRRALLTVGMVAISGMSALGLSQGGPGLSAGPGQTIGLVQTRLLVDPAVQKELKLDPTQVEKANQLAAEIREKTTNLRKEVLGLPRDAQLAKAQELGTRITDDALKSAQAFLTPAQIKRFHQIDVQAFGLIALTYDPIIKKVGITEDQGPKIRAIVVEFQSETRKLYQEAGVDRQAAMPKVEAAKKASLAKVVSLLTEDQKKAWNDLIGEPFDGSTATRPPR